MSKIDVKDRRIHPRLVTRLPVQGTPEEGGVVARMVARNLSIGGLYCSSSVDFPEMTRLSVRLMLPLGAGNGNETEPLDVEAVVVRREEKPAVNGERYELALYFTQIDDLAKDQLRRYLAEQDRAQGQPS